MVETFFDDAFMRNSFLLKKMDDLSGLDDIIVTAENCLVFPPTYDIESVPDEVYLSRATQYFIWCEQNPIKIPMYYGKDAVFKELDKPRPFTKEGLALAMMMTTRELTGEFKKLKPRLYDFLLDIIRKQIFEMSIVGVYQSAFAARYTELADKQEIQQGGQVVFSLSDNRSTAPSQHLIGE